MRRYVCILGGLYWPHLVSVPICVLGTESWLHTVSEWAGRLGQPGHGQEMGRGIVTYVCIIIELNTKIRVYSWRLMERRGCLHTWPLSL